MMKRRISIILLFLSFLFSNGMEFVNSDDKSCHQNLQLLWKTVLPAPIYSNPVVFRRGNEVDIVFAAANHYVNIIRGSTGEYPFWKVFSVVYLFTVYFFVTAVIIVGDLDKYLDLVNEKYNQNGLFFRNPRENGFLHFDVLVFEAVAIVIKCPS